MHHPFSTSLRLCAVATALAAVFSLAPAHAARTTSVADAAYQKERTACLDGSTQQGRKTCLREAEAAHLEARRGELQTESAQTLQSNKLKRCVAQPVGEQRTECLRMALGEGTVEGSVAAGGQIKELITVTPAPMMPMPMPAPKN